MRVIDVVLLVLVLLLAGYGLFRLVRWFSRPAPVKAHTTAWDTRYSVEGTQTVWWIYRDITCAQGTRRREKQEIARIDSAAANFDELFLRGEHQAMDRAYLLNSSLSG